MNTNYQYTWREHGEQHRVLFYGLTEIFAQALKRTLAQSEGVTDVELAIITESVKVL